MWHGPGGVWLGAGVVVLVGFLGGGIGREVGPGLFEDPDPASLEFLTGIVSTVNTNLPVMVDGETELFSSVALPGVIVYNYRLVNVLASEIEAGAIMELQSGVVTQACSTSWQDEGTYSLIRCHAKRLQVLASTASQQR